MSVKLTIKEMKIIAKSRRGRCLSKRYVDNKTKLKWVCEKGHIWKANPNDVKGGSWCPTCGIENGASKRRHTIEEMHKIAESRGGLCLSKKYVNGHAKLKWECKLGHSWPATPYSIITRKSWCPHCAGSARLTIGDMKRLAKKMGGRCLSKTYVNNRTKLKWQCESGHNFDAAPTDVQGNHWCPHCATPVSESICRKIFEIIFNEKFNKRKPEWLRSPKGRPMELDGYCEKLKIAFEYQGIQHFRNARMLNWRRPLRKQKKYDALKKELCVLHGITLIIIPYTIKHAKFLEYIIKQCRKNRIKLPAKLPEIDYKELGIYSSKPLYELQKIAKKRGGSCLSKVYIDSQTKLKWKCKKGHVWEQTPNHIKRGVWCARCAGLGKLTIVDMMKLARAKDGRCLSKKYVNALTKLRWGCKEGHMWSATPNSVKNKKTWCPRCARGFQNI